MQKQIKCEEGYLNLNLLILFLGKIVIKHLKFVHLSNQKIINH